MKDYLFIAFLFLLISRGTAQNIDSSNSFGNRNINKTISITVIPKRNFDPQDIQGLIESELVKRGYNVISSEVSKSVTSDKTQVFNDSLKMEIENIKTRTLNVNSTYVLSFDYDYTYREFSDGIKFNSFNTRIVDLGNGGKIIFSKSMKGSPKKCIKELVDNLEN